ncbi:Phosphoenolpyruvate-protein phosphotransferase [Fusobacterium necrophorum subsp. necrophorum]|nr:Phosphoenolpyruvate-protein phosphotransferase [Fusobacterium necrophorum subsp. necrophorum]
MLKQLQHKAAISKDGVEVGVWCNIGSPKDVKGVLNNGGQGIGLYRTEFLFMNNDRFPTEEEQFEAYKEVAMALEGKPVTIERWILEEINLFLIWSFQKKKSFLGWRAIRVCLDRIEIWKHNSKLCYELPPSEL